MNSEDYIEDSDKEKFIFENNKIFTETFNQKKNEKIEEKKYIEESKGINLIKNFLLKLILLVIIILIILESNIISSKKSINPVNKENKDNSQVVEESNKFENFDNTDKNDNTDNFNESDNTIDTKTDDTFDSSSDNEYDTASDIKTDMERDITEEQNLLNLYICTHKDFPDEINNRTYYKILCDREDQLKNNYSLEIIPTYEDNELYPKNIGYSECSKIYYIWKKYMSGNISSEYVGFNHYRRIFKFKNNVPNLTDIFNKYDVILHNEYNLGSTIKQQFSKIHFGHFLDEVIEIIKLNFSEYYPTALKSLKRTKMNICNIFIMKKEYFLKYGEFLFGVLMEFDRRHNLKTDNDLENFIIHEIAKTKKKNANVSYQRRVEAFLSERISQIFYDYHFKNPMQIGVVKLN